MERATGKQERDAANDLEDGIIVLLDPQDTLYLLSGASAQLGGGGGGQV